MSFRAADVLLSCFALLLMCGIALLAEAGGVYPACPAATTIHKQTFFPLANGAADPFISPLYVSASGGAGPQDLQTISKTGKQLITNAVKISCIGYEVYLSTVAGMCTVQPKSIYKDRPYRILIHAENIEDSSEIHWWDIDDVAGGSAESLIFRVKYDSRWGISIVNKDAKKCGLTFELGVQLEDAKHLDQTAGQPAHVPTLLPGLVDLMPRTLQKNENTKLVLKMRGGFDTAGMARVRPLYPAQMPTPIPTQPPTEAPQTYHAGCMHPIICNHTAAFPFPVCYPNPECVRVIVPHCEHAIVCTHPIGGIPNCSANPDCPENATTSSSSSSPSSETNDGSVSSNEMVSSEGSAQSSSSGGKPTNSSLFVCLHPVICHKKDGWVLHCHMNPDCPTHVPATTAPTDPEWGWTYLVHSMKTPQAEGFDLTGDQADYCVFNYYFQKMGVYAFEFARSNGTNVDSSWHSIGSLVVYAENPAYFVITSGAGPQGQLYENVKTTLRFQGTGLGIKDHVKFVDETKYRCADQAPAAGGVLAANPVFEGGGSELNADSMTWTFTLTEIGFFRVCYKKLHATNGIWHQILSRAEIVPLNPHTSPPNGAYPVPTNAVTKKDCDVTPESYILAMDNGTVPAYLIVTTDSPVFSFDFNQNIAKLLCVDVKTILIIELVHKNKDKTHNMQAYIDIDCTKSPVSEEESYNGANNYCNSDERKAQLMYKWQFHTNLLKEYGIEDVAKGLEKAEHVVQPEEPRVKFEDPDGKNQWVTVAIVVFIILVVIGLAIFCVFKKKDAEKDASSGIGTNGTGSGDGGGTGRSAAYSGGAGSQAQDRDEPQADPDAGASNNYSGQYSDNDKSEFQMVT